MHCYKTLDNGDNDTPQAVHECDALGRIVDFGAEPEAVMLTAPPQKTSNGE